MLMISAHEPAGGELSARQLQFPAALVSSSVSPAPVRPSSSGQSGPAVRLSSSVWIRFVVPVRPLVLRTETLRSSGTELRVPVSQSVRSVLLLLRPESLLQFGVPPQPGVLRRQLLQLWYPQLDLVLVLLPS